MARLKRAMRGTMDYIEMADGGRYWFEPEPMRMTLFHYCSDLMRAVYHGTPRPEPPEALRAVAGAADRERAFWQVYPQGIMPWCPLDIEALVGRGEFVPRGLVAGLGVDEPRLDSEDLSE